MTDASILDRQPRTYEGACADLIAKGARQERERIVAALAKHADDLALPRFLREAYAMAASFVRREGA